MLTGDSREHVVFVFHGAGCNGKSTLVETGKRLLGDLADTAPFETFTRAKADRSPRNDIARLHRSRLVIASESGAGHKLDEAIVKNLSGSDTVSTRFLYGEYFEFKPQFKIVLVSNHKPEVDGGDDAIWRRIRLIPFHVSFEGREDRDLAEKLEHELAGILAWAVRGCLDWQQHGLGQIDTVTQATREYRAEEDTLGAFIEERCTLTGSVITKQLFAAYEEYCDTLGEKPLAISVLGRQLKKRGIKPKGGRTRTYHGISLRDPGDDGNEAHEGRTGVSVTPPTRAGETGVSETAVIISHPSSQRADGEGYDEHLLAALKNDHITEDER
jgi:putative DNA primase/helicase